MELSKETIKILKTCNGINPTIAFKKGNIIRNASPNGYVLFKALIEEEFPIDFQLYDLGKFINSISLFGNPFLDFKEDYVAIKNSTSQIRNYYCHPEILGKYFDLTGKDINIETPIAEFELSSDHITKIYRSMSILGLDCMRIMTTPEKDVNVRVLARDAGTMEDYTVHTFTKATEDISLDIIMDCHQFTLIPTDYIVKVGNGNVIEFHSSEYNMTYWVAGNNNND